MLTVAITCPDFESNTWTCPAAITLLDKVFPPLKMKQWREQNFVFVYPGYPISQPIQSDVSHVKILDHVARNRASSLLAHSITSTV
jgi:hypothetical protein